jgi:hypothetical protein
MVTDFVNFLGETVKIYRIDEINHDAVSKLVVDLLKEEVPNDCTVMAYYDNRVEQESDIGLLIHVCISHDLDMMILPKKSKSGRVFFYEYV